MTTPYNSISHLQVTSHGHSTAALGWLPYPAILAVLLSYFPGAASLIPLVHTTPPVSSLALRFLLLGTQSSNKKRLWLDVKAISAIIPNKAQGPNISSSLSPDRLLLPAPFLLSSQQLHTCISNTYRYLFLEKYLKTITSIRSAILVWM